MTSTKSKPTAPKGPFVPVTPIQASLFDKTKHFSLLAAPPSRTVAELRVSLLCFSRNAWFCRGGCSPDAQPNSCAVPTGLKKGASINVFFL